MLRFDPNLINVQLSQKTVLIYSVRKLIQRSIDKNIQLFHGTIVDLCCWEMPYENYLLQKNAKQIKKYIGVDISDGIYHKNVNSDVHWNGRKIPFGDNYADTVIATELFEHLSNIPKIISETHKVLKTNGVLFFTTPFVWPLHETPNDQVRPTPYFLNKHIKKSKFKEVKIRPPGNYHASLAQMFCIWLYNFHCNHHMSNLRSKVFTTTESYILYPIIKKLIDLDEKLNIEEYGYGTMATGFYGYAKK